MSLTEERYHVTLEFTEPILGSVSKDKEIYASYIASKMELTEEALAEELETVPEKIEEKGWTGFHVEDGNPLLYNYVIRGFFKAACGALRRNPKTRSAKIRAYKKIIDGLVFIEPRRIPLIVRDGAKAGVMERPLRGQTAQGERVSLARSDTYPEGTGLEFDIVVLGSVKEADLKEWLDYGALQGLGQWRSGGYGTFKYQMERIE